MEGGEPCKDLPAIGSERYIDDTPVNFILSPHHEAVLYGALHQSDDGMWSLLKKLGQLGDCCRAPPGKSGYAEQ